VDQLLRDASRRQAIGDAGRAIAQRHSDLPERTAAALLGLAGLPDQSSHSPCGRGAGGGGDTNVASANNPSARSSRE
jgi:hypothetical protein